MYKFWDFNDHPVEHKLYDMMRRNAIGVLNTDAAFRPKLAQKMLPHLVQVFLYAGITPLEYDKWVQSAEAEMINKALQMIGADQLPARI